MVCSGETGAQVASSQIGGVMSTNTTHISIGRLYPKLTFYIYSQPGSGMYSKMKLDLQSIGTNLALTYIKCVPVFPE